MTTRDKIISSSRQLFNKSGYGAISLFDVAKYMNISRGNLTYHFKDKESLLMAILGELWEKIEVERTKTVHLPSFENIHNEIQLYFKYQEEYFFIFQDPYMLNNPFIHRKYREKSNQFIYDNKLVMAFSISIGNLKKEEVPGTYNHIAYLTWFIAFNWFRSFEINKEYTKGDGEKIIWKLILPYFTDKGVKSFKKFFGEDYFQSISEPFDENLSNYIPF